jgi:serine/threonine protein kinase
MRPVSAFVPRRFGSYFLQSRLGCGGMAEVFLARREGVAGFARTVVVKRILGIYQGDPNFVGMFINEAKIAAQLTHPNIVQVHELGQVDGEFFIAMEYVRGCDLLRLLQHLAKTRPQNSAVPPHAAAYIARETCRALQHAHDHSDEGRTQPIIHRDVSPQNIMISNDGQVKLVDFGIAKALGGLREETRTGVLKGKLAYMAPEQIVGLQPSPQTDVFAAGVVLHEMLTGRRLFKGATELETLSKVKSMAVPLPSSLSFSVPSTLDDVAMRALDRDPQTRYQRAGQMARDLDHYLQDVRFSMEDMAEFVTAVFAAEPMEITESRSEGQATAALSSDRVSGVKRESTGNSRIPVGVTGANVVVTTMPVGRRKLQLRPAVLVCSIGLLAMGMAWKYIATGRKGEVSIADGPATLQVTSSSPAAGSEAHLHIRATPASLHLLPELGRGGIVFPSEQRDFASNLRAGGAPFTLRLETVRQPSTVELASSMAAPTSSSPRMRSRSIMNWRTPSATKRAERPKIELFEDPSPERIGEGARP